MKKYIFALLVIGIFCLAGCSLPANKDSKNVNKNQTIPSLKKQNTEDTKKQAQEDIKKQPESDNTGIVQNAGTEEKANRTIEKTNAAKIRITLYYQDAEGFIIPVTRELERQEGIARLAVIALIDNSIIREELEYYGIYPVLPLNTEVMGINIKNGTAIIEFNNKLLNYKDETSEKNIVSSLVYTLTEFKNIENIKLLIRGYNTARLKFGTDISKPLNRQNVLINANKANLNSENSKLDVFMFKAVKKEMYALPVSVEYENVSEDEVPARIIEMSDKSYFDGKVQSQLPEGTRLRRSIISGSTLILDFNSTFIKYGGTAREDAILKQLQYSMKQIKGIDRIKILVEGKEVTLPEGSEISGGLKVPSEINYLNEE